ncbi:MAG: HD domain-containing protein [Oscillospiraceae bacterium]|nr:HD domain-containing protein [Oscillospiraceae bacterium]
MSDFHREAPEQRNALRYAAVLSLCCVALNLLGARLATATGLPLFLDTIGTFLAAILGGYLPGIVTGYLTNLLSSLGGNGINAYYATINGLIALCASLFALRGYFRSWWKTLLCTPVFALLGGGLGSVITWFLYGMDFGEGFSAPLAHLLYERFHRSVFISQLTADLLYDLLDKLITLALVYLLLRLLPDTLKEKAGLFGWRHQRLKTQANKATVRRLSLRFKTLLVLAAAMLVTGVAASCISYMLYRNATITDHEHLGKAVSDLAASVLDADRVDDYLAQGEAASGYADVEHLLYGIRESSQSIKYVYVYQIQEDGCHVVFDLDTEDTPASEPGEVIPFDESFAPYVADLLAGKPIDPLITDDTYGWLLTVYSPVYDSAGVCRCYAAADISMEQIRIDSYSYLTRVLALFLGFFIALLVMGFWLAEEHIVQPINAIADSASAFAYTDEDKRAESLERIHQLNIHTGDELENLYHSISKTTEDMVGYIAEVQHRGDVIERMQNGLIMVLADMVESRDKCTGDHVRKTAAYVRIIVEQLRADGVYADRLTDEFMKDVINSAPLHDVGKIRISDTLLNKPGKLTDEEFAEMKKHTIYGSEVLAQAIDLVPDSTYLDEAKNLAEFHHERWDGRGYPRGLKGEETPLSARIMAVADVFDALVSRRSYKEPFTFEKAMDIIKEESGTHFDPAVVDAFVRAEDRVRAVAKENAEK